jgi:hypothetical protein
VTGDPLGAVPGSTLATLCFLYVLRVGDLDDRFWKLGGDFCSPGRGLRKSLERVAYRSAGLGLAPSGAKARHSGAVTAALKRCATQNQVLKLGDLGGCFREVGGDF